jgi:hypothetical protein
MSGIDATLVSNATWWLSDNIRARTPTRLKRDVAKVRVSLRKPTARFRALPDALIIGAQRCGTSSLYKYLGGHPDVVPSVRKETEFFTRRFGMGVGWYRAHFPLEARLTLGRRHGMTFEATPDYLFHPLAPARAARLLPEAKIVVLLRDPVQRAFSHYRHMVRLGFESLAFEDALDAESSRLAPDIEAMKRDPLHWCRPFLHFSYVARGLYAQQLARWFDAFPRERFLLIKSEDFYAAPAQHYQEVVSFLGLGGWVPDRFANHSLARQETESAPLTASTHERLRMAFEREADELARLVGERFSWT